MTLKEVSLQPVNGKRIKVGVITDSYEIGSNRRGIMSVPIYDHRIIEYIGERAKERVHHKFDCPIVIAGPRRTGKSTNAIAIGRYINPNLTTEDIAFRLEDFRKVLARLPPADPENGFYPVAILDESGVDLYSKDWQMTLVKEMVKIFQIIGKKRITMILCLPHRNLLTVDIREQMFLWVQTKTLDGERGFAELREGCENIWKMDLYWKPLCGFVYDALTDPFWLEYEVKKDAFIEDYTKVKPETGPNRNTMAYRYITERNKIVRLAIRKGISRKEIMAETGMHPDAVSRAVASKIEK